MKHLEELKSFYQGKKIYLTGHTGFKGSWLAYWLTQMGATVFGQSLAPLGEHSHYADIKLSTLVEESLTDINDLEKTKSLIKDFQPDIVFHLAAQAIVRSSYVDTVNTWATNMMGTVHVLEAIREVPNIKAGVMITTDKVYQNSNQNILFGEEHPLGAADPYSSSKACADIITQSYQKSFFPLDQYGSGHQTLLAPARAGNVIGGGDWANDRLIPDLIRGVEKNNPTLIRNPLFTRPWQHVLIPLSGYLLLGKELFEGNTKVARPFNFAPNPDDCLAVKDIVERSTKIWPKFQCKLNEEGLDSGPKEAQTLKLSFELAQQLLNWNPVWNVDQALNHTISWYQNYLENKTVNTEQDLNQFLNDAKI